ncbi:cupin domain-containing protein [Tautonia rosea]|uniref:cupin domain-containing protein n=1 Tax=Tautonia rosea TaxID=2728037 RepID=UPI0014765221|nr:cupin domain-containing protein [Tautonia rosea]
MSTAYTYVADLNQESIPLEDGILSHTIHQDDRVKAVLFTFAAGQELSEHTASTPAILQFISGEAKLTLGQEMLDARPGTFAHMPAGLSHAIQAKTLTVMLLLLLKG